MSDEEAMAEIERIHAMLEQTLGPNAFQIGSAHSALAPAAQ